MPGDSLGATVEPLDALLTPLLPRAYAFAVRLARDRAAAEDLVQDAALAACRGFDTYAPGTNFKAWFFRILTNCHYARHRRREPETTAVQLDDAPELFLYARTADLGWHRAPGDPAQTLMSRLDAAAVAAALEGLPEEYRVVATLYFVGDLSYEEIARSAGIPVGTVRSRLHRGRKILQQGLWRVAVDRGLVPETKGTPA
jgi:RNA polymerase sigma-70 factor, ECF subfamily